MKEFSIGSHICYEFSNVKLAEDILAKLNNLSYISTSPINSTSQSQAGYALNEFGNTQLFYDKEMYKWFYDCLDIVAKNHLKTFKLNICDLWVTKTTFTQASEFHSHPLSVFSGLFYLQDCKDSHTTFLIADSFHQKWNAFLGDEHIKLHNSFFRSKSERGKLIIWPSEIGHKIDRHTDKFVRHTIAFNTMFSGQSFMPTKRINFFDGRDSE